MTLTTEKTMPTKYEAPCTDAELVVKLAATHNLDDAELTQLLESTNQELNALLAAAADKTRRQSYGDAVYIRGLIEFTNYCKNNCYYCGIRAGNCKAQRYRLSQEQILRCCAEGYELGFRTFVLQGGEDPYFTDDKVCHIVGAIRAQHPDCAITLSIGEKKRHSYQAFFDAGANRYLLRHETANPEHYGKLHPSGMSLENRQRCLYALKEIGYQVGSGFMVGSPYQSTATLIQDIRFLQQLEPDMIGIGPYINHPDTPFKNMPSGTAAKTLRLLSMLRLFFPHALLPSTTALGTIHPQGRELGLQAGGNVVMPNLSPVETRRLYELYTDKICMDAEAAQGLSLLKEQVTKAGYHIVTDRGDVKRPISKL